MPEYGRSPFKALANLPVAARLVLRRRRKTVVTSGAGVVAPFCILAGLMGARVVYLETMARVNSPSMTARVLSRITARALVQWPELAERLPRGQVCRPTLLEGLREGDPPPGTGTFIAVGTHAQPYTRFLDVVSRGLDEGLLPMPARPQVGQAGWSADGTAVTDYMCPEELDAAVRAADVVICQEGQGSSPRRWRRAAGRSSSRAERTSESTSMAISSS